MKTLPSQLVIAGIVFLAINASATVLYVDLNSANPTPPYADWSTAATNIQDAVDVSTDGDQILVTNGVYQTGGRVVYGSLTNRVAVTRAVTVQSINGPATTIIQGYQMPDVIVGDAAVRCVYLTSGAVLAGFTLTNGATYWDEFEPPYEITSGAGVWCESPDAVVTNCVLSGNSAAREGGGAFGGTLNNCVLVGNSAANEWGYATGGGAESATLNNCALSANTAYYGGGADYSTLNNCTLTGNSASSSGGGAESATLNNCALSANTAYYGGGADNSALNDCVLSNNTATAGFPSAVISSRASPQQRAPASGGGAAWSTLTRCNLTENQADGEGGGAYASILDQCMLAGNLAESGGGADSSSLSNCLLTGNSADYGGGVAYCEWLANCTLTGNTAAYDGGGAYDVSTLDNCALTGNTADSGGGTCYSTLNNCTLTGNSSGGDWSVLNNCIAYFNDGGNYDGSTLNYCCTTPLPTDGVGNITNEPSLADPEGGDFHLLKNSPCINSGNNSFVTLTNDLNGNPRIAGGTVDIGAYEFQWPMSVISYAWLQQYDLSTSGSDDYADSDGDGMNNWQEWRTGTIPTDASSLLKMTTVTNDDSGMTVNWQSVSGVTYFLQRGTDLGAQPAFSTIQTGIAGQPGTTSYTDTDATGTGPYFYRVGVQ